MVSRRTTNMVALAALVLVDIVLVALALRSPTPADEITTASRPASSTPAPAEPSTEPSGAPEETTSAREAVTHARMLLSAAAGGVAARAIAGSCADQGQATLQLSADGGDTWREVDVPATSLLRIRAESADEAWVVGTSLACNPLFMRTNDGGRTWRADSGTAGAWHLLPSAADGLHAPEERVDSPCARRAPPVDLDALDARRATLLCPNGGVQVTADAGTTWEKVGQSAGATALTHADRTAFSAAPGTGSCAGTVVRVSADGGASWHRRGCADGATGDVALAFVTPDRGLLASAEGTWRTRDGGRTWSSLD